MLKNYPSKFQYTFHLFQPTDPIRVFELGCHKTPPAHAYGPATRPFYLLHLIEKGSGYIERKGVRRYLGEGEAFLIVPEEITLYCADEHTPWEYAWIAFDGECVEGLLAHVSKQPFMKYQKSGLLALKNLINQQSPDHLSCLRTLFEVLDSVKDAPLPTERDSVADATYYIENNYFQPIRVETLAAQFGFTRAYFSTLFQRRTGETPHDYLTKIRIKHAKLYLQNTQYSVEEIAYLVGFTSLQRFSEAFKRRVGLSPLQFRQSVTV